MDIRFNLTIPGQVSVTNACQELISAHGYQGPFNVTASQSYEEVNGVKRRKPKDPWLDPTPYHFYKRRLDNAQGSCWYKPNGVSPHTAGQYYWGVVGGSAASGRFNSQDHFNSTLTESAILTEETSLRNTALIAVRNKLKSTKVDLGVAFGERKQTAMLLGDTAKRIAGAVVALKRGRIRDAMNRLGISSRRRQPRGSNVPQRWLELQYGWKPLLSDVYGAASALEKRPKGDWRVTAKVTRKVEVFKEVRREPHPTQNFDAFVCQARCLQSVYARIDALPQNEATISLVSLGVTNPLNVAWNLVPWSFVVDWVYPIGDFLESLDALLGYGQTSYSSTYLVRATWNERGLTGSNGDWYTRNNFRGRKRVVYVERSVSSTVPLPSLPSFKDPRSLGHMANGLALLATAFGRKR